jgi:hypothetical protein
MQISSWFWAKAHVVFFIFLSVVKLTDDREATFMGL